MFFRDSIHKKNVLLFRVIIIFYIIQVAINIIGEGPSSVFPMFLLFTTFGGIVFLLIRREFFPKVTMYFMVTSIYLYFFFLLNDSPYLVNYFFMWLGLPLSTIYQNIRVIILAGSLSLLLTAYTYVHFQEEIFPNVIYEDFIYLLLFGIFLTAFFITNVKMISRLQAKINHLAFHDHLTGVANRYSLERKFEDLLDTNIKSLAVLFIDLNAFKQINDKYGHKTGDEVLQKAVLRIRNKLTYSQLLCRLGGDEFVILIDNFSDQQIRTLIKEIENALEAAIQINEHSIQVSASIGMSYTTKRSEMNLQRMIDQADTAMYLIKHA
ncbi:GGDEF domain-containing protein [Cytobacillus sp. FJAT-54145]|uniref:GGDEF domain-containing protein n=1 Tax=Cytobacillus spartinae TaxID=3299023 RepID=A0ABW6KD54_9BACI